MDVEYLYQKQEAGAEFVVTQLFYDVDAFVIWYKACRARGVIHCFLALTSHLTDRDFLHRDYDSNLAWYHANTKLSILQKNDQLVQK
jgi:hypothetical protein